MNQAEQAVSSLCLDTGRRVGCLTWFFPQGASSGLLPQSPDTSRAKYILSRRGDLQLDPPETNLPYPRLSQLLYFN
jgi:hypothetical protein